MVFPIFRQGRTILMENLKKIKDKMDVICLAIGGILLLYAGSEEEFTTCSDWWLAFLVASGIGFLYVATTNTPNLTHLRFCWPLTMNWSAVPIFPNSPKNNIKPF